MVFPAHDYKGETVTTIGEERAFNPRLQVRSVEQYVELMNNLNLPNPKMMDVAVPANMRVGLAQEAIARHGWALSAAEAMMLIVRPDVTLVDLREKSEREKHGVIPGSLHAPYPDLAANVQPGGMLHELARATRNRIVFYCAFGERSAMAVQAAQDAGITERLPHPGRHRRLEEGLRPAGAVTCTARASSRSALILRSGRSPHLEGWRSAPNLRPCFETRPAVAPQHEGRRGSAKPPMRSGITLSRGRLRRPSGVEKFAKSASPCRRGW